MFRSKNNIQTVDNAGILHITSGLSVPLFNKILVSLFVLFVILYPVIAYGIAGYLFQLSWQVSALD